MMSASKTPSSADAVSARTSAGEVGHDMPLESGILYHIFILNSVLERAGNRVTEAYGLTLPQWMALGCVGRGGNTGVTHSELGKKLMLSKAPITGVVDRLERAEYVRRETSATDRRVSRIYLTPSGEKAWHDVRAAMRDLAIQQCGCLEDSEKKQMFDWLRRLLGHVAASDPTLALPICPVRRDKEGS